MALKQIDHGTPEYRKMINLRMDILRKPLGLSFTQEELSKEKDDILIGAFEDVVSTIYNYFSKNYGKQSVNSLLLLFRSATCLLMILRDS